MENEVATGISSQSWTPSTSKSPRVSNQAVFEQKSKNNPSNRETVTRANAKGISLSYWLYWNKSLRGHHPNTHPFAPWRLKIYRPHYFTYMRHSCSEEFRGNGFCFDDGGLIIISTSNLCKRICQAYELIPIFWQYVACECIEIGKIDWWRRFMTCLN